MGPSLRNIEVSLEWDLLDVSALRQKSRGRRARVCQLFGAVNCGKAAVSCSSLTEGAGGRLDQYIAGSVFRTAGYSPGPFDL
jgi:hypothetical protein